MKIWYFGRRTPMRKIRLAYLRKLTWRGPWDMSLFMRRPHPKSRRHLQARLLVVWQSRAVRVTRCRGVQYTALPSYIKDLKRVDACGWHSWIPGLTNHTSK